MTEAMESDAGQIEAHELLEIVSRLGEVRRRFIRHAGEGERFDLAEERLDEVILDLKAWLKPGGSPVELDDLGLRLGALEEMLEGLGFPGYAHVVESIRDRLAALEDPNEQVGGDEPPPPRRFEPPPHAAAAVRRSPRTRAPTRSGAERRGGERRRIGLWVALLLIVVGAGAAAVVDYLTPGGLLKQPRFGSKTAAVRIPEVGDEHPEPATGPRVEPTPEVEPFRAAAHSLGELVHELGAAEDSLNDGDLDDALQHFANAAAIDRHHRGVISMASNLIAALLRDADQAFDNGQWSRAAARVDDARHLANGLYLDTTEIEQTARRHAAMTRFVDLRPSNSAGIRAAVGRAVRVTLTTGDQLFGRLEAFEDNRAHLAIQSGVEGGGVRFSKEIALAEMTEIRVYEASNPSQVVLGGRTSDRSPERLR